LSATSLARSQPPAVSPPPAKTPTHPTEQPPPAAAQVPTVVPPAPTPDAPPQELAPVPPSAPEVSPPATKPSDAKPEPPPKRTLYNGAIVQALDKVTAESLRFEIQVRKPVRYKGLIFTLHTCETSPPGQLPSAFAHLEIDSQPVPLPGRPPNPARLVFKGWMAADAPGLHPLEHPVYDAWLIACKTASGPAPAAKR
jgi:hypothetical protein